MRREKLLLRLVSVQDVEALLPRLCGGKGVGFTLKRPDEDFHSGFEKYSSIFGDIGLQPFSVMM